MAVTHWSGRRLVGTWVAGMVAECVLIALPIVFLIVVKASSSIAIAPITLMPIPPQAAGEVLAVSQATELRAVSVSGSGLLLSGAIVFYVLAIPVGLAAITLVWVIRASPVRSHHRRPRRDEETVVPMKDVRGFLLAVALLGTACAGAGRTTTRVASVACESGDSVQVRTELFFGRNILGGGEVSDSAWNEFVASYVTPRFPSGLTIIESAGQWRNSAGVVEREKGKILQVGGEDVAVARRLSAEVATEYKRRFRQEAVLRMTSGVCVRFFDA